MGKIEKGRYLKDERELEADIWSSCSTSTPYPENMSFKLALSSKIGGFEILNLEKKYFFPGSEYTRRTAFKGHPHSHTESFRQTTEIGYGSIGRFRVLSVAYSSVKYKKYKYYGKYEF